MSLMLEVAHLSKQFKDTLAVNDLSFTVNEGDVYGFLGQNGAGKSTTLRMLLTLIHPTSGEIHLFGKNILDHPNHALEQTGAVIERPDLYKYLSAYDNLYIFAKMSGIKPTQELIMKNLQLVGLSERAQSKVKTFSQGMKQRLGIAVALVHNPRLVILDEPTNGLDPQGIADMRQLILHLSRDLGKTVIVSSHLLNEIEQIANRMIIIHKGSKIAEGNVAELLDPGNTLVELDTTDNPRAFSFLQQSSFTHGLEQKDGLIRLHMDRQEIPRLVETITTDGQGILSVRPRHSLEDYFLSLTNPDTHVESPANRIV
ncbi:MAG: Phosphonate-transporting ATPase [Ferruginibacter sp.]|nr:Phosphonate-transporting ATPase [Ferruginibacter sp.]